MLQRRYRLPSNLFKYIYEKGVKYRNKFGMLVVTPYSTEITPKFGFVVSKKIGNAPQRHRVTRLLRVITQECIKELNLDDNGNIYEYIAFEYCDDYYILKDSVTELLKKSQNEKDFTMDN